MRLSLKRAQLWLHHHYVDIRHWLVVIIGVILLIFSMVSLSNQNRLNSKVAVLAEQNKILSQQNKALNQKSTKLGEENQSIAKQNRSYTRCLATIFAQYTHDFIPINITNLDTCTTESQSQATNNTPTGGSSPTGGAPASDKPAAGSQPAADPTPAQPQPTQPEPVKVLGIPVCLPFTGICAR